MRQLVQRGAGAMLWVLLLAASISRAEPNALRAIDISRDGDRIVIRAQLSHALTTLPPSFATITPPRIVIDLPDTVNATSTMRQSLDLGDVRHVDIVQAGTRTRIVINLKRPIPHSSRLHDKEVQVVLGESATTTTPVTASAAEKVAKSLAKETQSWTSIFVVVMTVPGVSLLIWRASSLRLMFVAKGRWW
jgi:type IV pilus assembly protein PilQ